MLTYRSLKFGAILGNFKLWVQIYLERINIPKIDNKIDRLPFFRVEPKNGWTLVY